MFQRNKGYLDDNSRSVRSQEALDRFEVPISMFTKELIQEFLEMKNPTPAQQEVLKDFKVAHWKYSALERISDASWHHTGKFFNPTDHYPMQSVYEDLLKNPSEVKQGYVKWVAQKKKEKAEGNACLEIGIAEKIVWGGTKRRPKYLGTETLEGVIRGDWLYYESGSSLRRVLVFGSGIESLERFATYAEMVKAHPERKNTFRLYRRIAKRLQG